MTSEQHMREEWKAEQEELKENQRQWRERERAEQSSSPSCRRRLNEASLAEVKEIRAGK